MKAARIVNVLAAMLALVSVGLFLGLACTPSPARAYTPPIYAWDDKDRGVTCYWHEALATDGPGFSCVRTRP
jgi:hypothetical protein